VEFIEEAKRVTVYGTVCSDVVKRYVVDAAKIEGYKVRMDL
jgi:hypothetical protein